MGLTAVPGTGTWGIEVTISPDETKANRTVEFTLTLENTGTEPVSVCQIDINYVDWDSQQRVFPQTPEEPPVEIGPGGSMVRTTTEAIPERLPGDYSAIVTVTAFTLPDLLCSQADPNDWPLTIKIVANVPPSAGFSFDPSTSAPDDVVYFLDESSDSDGDIVGRRWDFRDGAIIWNVENPTHAFMAAGNYEVVLIVTDDEGSNDTISHTVQVVRPNQAPRADFSYTPLNADTNEEIQFYDRSSDDGTVVRRRWDFGDGGFSTEQDPRHRFLEPGIYPVLLTVVDDDNLTAVVTRNVLIAAAPGGRDPRPLGLGVVEWGAVGAILAAISGVVLLFVWRRTRPSRRWGQTGNSQPADRTSRWRPR